MVEAFYSASRQLLFRAGALLLLAL